MADISSHKCIDLHTNIALYDQYIQAIFYGYCEKLQSTAYPTYDAVVAMLIAPATTYQTAAP